MEEKAKAVDSVEKAEALLKEIDAFIATKPAAEVLTKAEALKADVTKKMEELKAPKKDAGKDKKDAGKDKKDAPKDKKDAPKDKETPKKK
jgi:hypothetical protein